MPKSDFRPVRSLRFGTGLTRPPSVCRTPAGENASSDKVSLAGVSPRLPFPRLTRILFPVDAELHTVVPRIKESVLDDVVAIVIAATQHCLVFDVFYESFDRVFLIR